MKGRLAVSDHEGQLVIKNGNVLSADGELQTSDVLVEDGQIREIGANLEAEVCIDAAEAYVLPGLIDIHTHGIGFAALESSTLREYAEFEAACGATTLYPTLAGSPSQNAELMQRHRLETNELSDLPQIAGFRLEFPRATRCAQ